MGGVGCTQQRGAQEISVGRVPSASLGRSSGRGWRREEKDGRTQASNNGMAMQHCNVCRAIRCDVDLGSDPGPTGTYSATLPLPGLKRRQKIKIRRGANLGPPGSIWPASPPPQSLVPPAAC